MKALLYLLAALLPYLSLGQCQKGNCKNGTGLLKLNEKSYYKGSFTGGRFHGDGELHFANGDVYKGQFANGQMEKIGKYTFADGSQYIGDFHKGLRSGKGKMTFGNSEEYKGEWTNGKMDGHGTYTFKDGSVFEGQWSEGKMNGQGQMTTSQGRIIKGQWIDNKFVNDKHKSKPTNSKSTTLKNCTTSYCHLEKGAFYYEDGSIYFGDFVDGSPDGIGRCEYANGDIYEGGWKNHGPHGQGTIYTHGGYEIAGEYANGKLLSRTYPSKSDTDYRPVNTLSSHKEPKKGSQIYAIIVGVSTYNHLQSLKYTDDDAYHLYAFLKSPQGGAIPDDHIKLLIDEAATKSKVEAAIHQTLAMADKDDVVMLYLSGHGLDGAYVPYDFDGTNNLLAYQDVLSLLDQSPAKHKLMITDACHSGSLYAARGRYDEQLEKFYHQINQSQGGTALMTSSRDTEVSLEYSGMRQGIFSHFLIRGLKGEANKNGDDQITLQELFDFISINVKHYSNGRQNPMLKGTASMHTPIAMVFN